MVFPIVHYLLLCLLGITSYIDLKTKEVPDTISYGLMIGGIGLRMVYSAIESTWMPLLEGLFGMAILFFIAALLYYTGQWGGGDAKLLTGLGAVLGLQWTTLFQFTVFYVLFLFIAGGLYGAVWSTCLFLQKRKRCSECFFQMHKKGTGERYLVLGCAALVALGAVLVQEKQFSTILGILALSIVLFYYTWLFLQVMEKICLQRYVQPQELTEGDWIVHDVYVAGKRICGPADLGISNEQIAQLTKYYAAKKVGKILMKDGIPFVPSFFLAYGALIALQSFLP